MLVRYESITAKIIKLESKLILMQIRCFWEESLLRSLRFHSGQAGGRTVMGGVYFERIEGHMTGKD